MDIHDSLFSSSCMLNEQVARQIFEILPEDGPMMVILDRDGNCWPSDTERFMQLNLSEVLVGNLCARIDDGNEPIVTQIDEHSIIATQLATEHANCGYVIIAIPHHSPESTLISSDIIEMVLNQIGLILRLIEKNNTLCRQHAQHVGMYSRGVVSTS